MPDRRWDFYELREAPLDDEDKAVAAPVPRSPREQAEFNRRDATTKVAGVELPLRPRSPREQAEYNRFGTINGVPVTRPKPKVEISPPPKPGTWAALLKKA